MPTRHPDQEPVIRVRPLSRQESTQLGEATTPGSRAYLVETSDRYVDFLATLLDLLPGLAEQQLRTGLKEKFAALVEHLVRDMVPLPSDDAHQAIQIARLRQQIAAEFPLWTSKELAENAGSRSANPSSLTHNWRKARRIFGVRVLAPSVRQAHGLARALWHGGHGCGQHKGPVECSRHGGRVDRQLRGPAPRHAHFRHCFRHPPQILSASIYTLPLRRHGLDVPENHYVIEQARDNEKP